MERSYLLIPHAPATKLKTRADELAVGLAENGHRVEICQRRKQESGLSAIGKAQWHMKEALRGVSAEPFQKNINRVFPPTLHYSSLVQRRFDLYASMLLQARGNDITISSAFGGPSFPPLGTRSRLVYDYVDDHASGWRHAGEHRLAKRVEKFMSREIARADSVICSSMFLVDEARKKFGREAHYVPNGANVERIRSLDRSSRTGEHRTIRVLYMGGLDYFVKIEWPMAAIERLRKSQLDVELWVVGDGPAIQGKSFPDWVKILGFRMPEEIPGILAQVDVGVLPFVLNPFTDAALPLKILEYGAARLPTVSSPLSELRIQKFPWVAFADGDPESWHRSLADAVDRARATEWNAEWDAIVDLFSWRRIAASLDTLFREGRA